MSNRASVIAGNSSRTIERHLGSSYKTVLYIAGRIPWLEDFLSAIDGYLGGYLGDYEEFPTETPQGGELEKGMFFINTIDTYLYFYIGEGQWTSVYEQVVLGKAEIDAAVAQHIIDLEQATVAHLLTMSDALATHLLTMDTAKSTHISDIDIVANAHITLMDSLLSQVTQLASEVEDNTTLVEGYASQTSADRTQTGEDVVSTGEDRAAVAADRVQIGLDRVQTGEDRVQTGLDAASTAADVTSSNDSKLAAESAESQAEAHMTAAEGSKNASSGFADDSEASALRAEAAAVSMSTAITPRGDWDASTGSFPTPTTVPMETSDWYQITTAGTMTDSNPDQPDVVTEVGDNLYWHVDKNIWYLIDNTQNVTTVQGRKGAVVITQADVGLGNVSNLAISDVYNSDGSNYASRTALYNAYTTLNNGKLGINANAVSATKLVTARTISISDGATGEVTFDGSANVAISVTITDNSHAHTIANVTGLQAELDEKLSKNTPDTVSAVITYTAKPLFSTGINLATPISGTPEAGDIKYDPAIKEFRGHNGEEWSGIGGGGVAPIAAYYTADFTVLSKKIAGVLHTINSSIVATIESDTWATDDWAGFIDTQGAWDDATYIALTLTGASYWSQLDSQGNQTKTLILNKRNASVKIIKLANGDFHVESATFGQDADWATSELLRRGRYPLYFGPLKTDGSDIPLIASDYDELKFTGYAVTNNGDIQRFTGVIEAQDVVQAASNSTLFFIATFTAASSSLDTFFVGIQSYLSSDTALRVIGGVGGAYTNVGIYRVIGIKH